MQYVTLAYNKIVDAVYSGNITTSSVNDFKETSPLLGEQAQSSFFCAPSSLKKIATYLTPPPMPACVRNIPLRAHEGLLSLIRNLHLSPQDKLVIALCALRDSRWTLLAALNMDIQGSPTDNPDRQTMAQTIYSLTAILPALLMFSPLLNLDSKEGWSQGEKEKYIAIFFILCAVISSIIPFNYGLELTGNPYADGILAGLGESIIQYLFISGGRLACAAFSDNAKERLKEQQKQILALLPFTLSLLAVDGLIWNLVYYLCKMYGVSDIHTTDLTMISVMCSGMTTSSLTNSFIELIMSWGKGRGRVSNASRKSESNSSVGHDENSGNTNEDSEGETQEV